MNSTHAVFVELSPHVDIYNTRKYPFIMVGQMLNATHIISIPLDDFVRFSKRIGDPCCSTSWMFHTSRCGSTLVAQGLNVLPGYTVIPETQSLLIHLDSIGRTSRMDYNSYLKSSRCSDILSAAIIYLLKDFKKGDKVFIKTPGLLHYCIMAVIAKRFPSHKFISLHRDGAATLDSFWRVAMQNELIVRVASPFPMLVSLALKPMLFMMTNCFQN